MESENRTYLLEGHLQYEKEGIWGKSNSYLHHDSLFQQVLFIKNHFSIHSKLYLIASTRRAAARFYEQEKVAAHPASFSKVGLCQQTLARARWRPTGKLKAYPNQSSEDSPFTGKWKTHKLLHRIPGCSAWSQKLTNKQTNKIVLLKVLK